MFCSYHSSCIDLSMSLVDSQVEGFLWCLNFVFQGEYVILNDINFGRDSGIFVANLLASLGGGGQRFQIRW